MAKRKRQGGSATTERRLEEGRGTGRGRDYQPWLLVQDVPSHGLANRVLGSTTGREHHLFSNLEFDCFLVFDWADTIIDIREQYPLLPLEETLSLAEEAGIKHPTYPGTDDPDVRTTDFLLTIRRGNMTVEQAIAVKPSEKLASKRVLEKLELERRFWEKRQTSWRIVTERDIPRILVENLKWLKPYQRLDALFPLTGEDVARIRAVLEHYRSDTDILTEVTKSVDDRLGLVPGTSLSVARHLLASRIWRVDLSLPLLEDGCCLHFLDDLHSPTGVNAS
ncbi:MAG TPA: TnsA endonuclease N-terminal domain-containing protein [Spirochaetia bacterium]|nr:TnsA endonuclease N-terminal domain-containing protein [Spirochaetia bacterium]